MPSGTWVVTCDAAGAERREMLLQHSHASEAHARVVREAELRAVAE